MFYIDEESFIDKLLLNFEFNPKFDIFIGFCLAQKSAIVSHKTEPLLLLDLFEVDLFVLNYDLETIFLSNYLKEFAFFSLVTHVVPQTDSSTLLERPPDFILYFEAVTSVEIDVAVKFGVLR